MPLCVNSLDCSFLQSSDVSAYLVSDITLPIKICLVKAIVFPVVTYGCESWTIKKAEC